MAGERALLRRPELERFVSHELHWDTPEYQSLKSRHFLIDDDSDVAIDLLALNVRSKAHRLADFTGLHMFVTTLRCEHSCPCCQVSRRSEDRATFDMTQKTAYRALDFVFRSPSPTLKIEFQGGESFLNFDSPVHVVREAKRRNQDERRDLAFVVATNLAIATDEMLAFCRDEGVLVSTSLDGPADLHNANGPRPGRDSYERAVAGISRARHIVGQDRVSALMTTTKASLCRSRDIYGFANTSLYRLYPVQNNIKARAVFIKNFASEGFGQISGAAYKGDT